MTLKGNGCGCERGGGKMNDKGERIYADIIFHGGDIITVDDDNPSVEALAVKDGNIVAAGRHKEVFELKRHGTEVVDLGGKTLMPGLMEPHSHPVISALLYDWIDASGFNNASGVEVMDKLQKAATEVNPGEWISAFGYDPILTRDLKALNADILDNISSANPIFVMVQSMHTVYVNRKAFELAGITNDTPQPQGGTFVKDDAGRLTGMVIEQGAILLIMAALLQDSQKDAAQLIEKQLRRYGEAGYTAVGAAGVFPVFPDAVYTLKQLVEKDNCPVRMVVMDKATDLESGLSTDPGPGNELFNTAGVKFWYDGSPYTGNMLLDKPFLNSELMQEGLGLPKDNCGYSMLPRETFKELVQKYHDQGRQLSVHAQGDRAIRDTVDVFEQVLNASPRDDHRHRIEHCGLFPIDQLERAAGLGLTPSWHINHIYYYGEALRDEIIGPERANIFMPMAIAQKYGLRSSLHNDSPMYPAEPFKLLRTAVTRKTRKNQVIGPDQAISIEDGIRALTINAAWQMFMEDKVGSLEVGKMADLTVLSQNPLKTDPDLLDQIQVTETYRSGRRHASVTA